MGRVDSEASRHHLMRVRRSREPVGRIEQRAFADITRGQFDWDKSRRAAALIKE
jgi:hypothetical protein